MTPDLTSFTAAKLTETASLLGGSIDRLPVLLAGLPPVLACQLVLEVVEVARRVELLAAHVEDAAKGMVTR